MTDLDAIAAIFIAIAFVAGALTGVFGLCVFRALRRDENDTEVPTTVPATMPCPAIATMGVHACADRATCWEPCGLLGNDAAHVRVVQVAEKLRPPSN